MKMLIARYFIAIYLCCSFAFVFAQKQGAAGLPKRAEISKKDLIRIKKMEDSLHVLSNLIIDDSLLASRKEACYKFIPMFKRALEIPNSFYFAFDSFETISKTYPPDSSFRIFTWQLSLPRNKFRYYGVIQMRSSKLKFFPLYDMSDTLQFHSQQIIGNNNWYGVIYYNIIEHMVDKKPMYTLFGFESADALTKRKLIDILTFDEKGQPVFGAPKFIFTYNDTFHLKPVDTLNRFFIEYKWQAGTVLNYDTNLQMIVFDHVAPPSEKARDSYFTYVPDGTYEGFKWGDDRWNWIERVFTFSIDQNDNPPIPVPLFGKPKSQPELPKEELGPR